MTATTLPLSDKKSGSTLTIADEGERLRRLTRVLFTVIWIVPGLLAASQVVFMGRITGDNYSIPTALEWQLLSWGLWALWSQIILTLVDRVPLEGGRFRSWIATHIVACITLCTLMMFAIAGLDLMFRNLDPRMTYREVVYDTVLSHIDIQVVLYWAVLGAAYMVEFVRRYRERDRVAAELEQKLARTQLEALRMQLNPHFLFNALNSVTELMEMDVRKAQRTLGRVSDLLRLSLRSAATPTIPLWQEIELVELYLHIARVRYGDGLSVEIEVDPAAVDLDVPSFVLQPLVENALKHGLSPDRQGQEIHVSARRQANSLELLVQDNGRGLDGLITTSGRFLAARPSVDGLGIGLTNTRSRLTMLFGDRYLFTMTNKPGGGCRVEIRIPIE